MLFNFAYPNVANVEYLQNAISENSLSILEIQAADTITAETSIYLVRDILSDTTGYLNTIDLGTTTAFFNSNKYLNFETPADENMPETPNGNLSGTAKSGMKFTMTANKSLYSITKEAGCNATKGYLLNGTTKAVIATATFSGNVAIFSPSQSLVSGTSYYISVDSEGGNYTSRWIANAYPDAATSLNWVGGMDEAGADSDSRAYDFTKLSYGSGATNKIIQTTSNTLSFTPTKFQIFAYKSSIAGTGTITADISFDNGAHYQTGIILDIQENIINSGTDLILKINLNAGALAGTAETQGYGVLFW